MKKLSISRQTSSPPERPRQCIRINPTNSNEVYGAIEVGGIIRSLDGGEHWENMSHGQYLNDDTVDMHGVLVARWRPGTIFAIMATLYLCYVVSLFFPVTGPRYAFPLGEDVFERAHDFCAAAFLASSRPAIASTASG